MIQTTLHKTLLVLVLLAVAGCEYLTEGGKVSFATIAKLPSATPNLNNPCLGKKICVAAYVAPWCPSCRASEGVVKKVQERISGSSNAGMIIFVGLDRPDKLKEMARNFNGYTLLDTKGLLPQDFGSFPVPQWFVWDQEGNILRRFSGAPSSSGDAAVEWLIVDKLQLKL